MYITEQDLAHLYLFTHRMYTAIAVFLFFFFNTWQRFCWCSFFCLETNCPNQKLS